MHLLRRTHKSVAALLLLLVLGLQVQGTFACEMMDYSGPVNDCCCEPAEQVHAAAGNSCGCCEYGGELVVKGADPEQEESPFSIGSSPEIKPPPIVLAFLAVWLEQPVLTANTPSGDAADPPLLPGTNTYLLTQRLRI